MKRSTRWSKRMGWIAVVIAMTIGIVPTSILAAPETAGSGEVEHFSILQIEVQGNTLFPDETVNNVTRRFLGENKTIKDIELLQDAVLGIYKSAGYSLVSVAVFDQQGSREKLTVAVKEDVLRAIQIKGNKKLREKDIRATLPALKPGASINIRNLDKQVLAANENPSRAISVALQTIGIGVFDAIVTVTEGKMITNTISLDNTGYKHQDPLRYKYQFTDTALGPAQDATGVFIYYSSPNKTTEQYLLYYNQPFHETGGSLALFAAKSKNASGLARTGYGDFNVTGSGRFYSMHYMQPIYRTVRTKIALDFGLEYIESVDNTSIFNIDVGPDINARPFSIGLHYNRRGVRDDFSASLIHVQNISGSYLNDNESYSLVRPNAVANYQLLRGTFNYLYRFKNGWLFNNHYEWQYTMQELIPDQQFGLGGARSVRGFEERELLGDKGFSASFEIYTPVLAKKIRLLAFYDIGQVWSYDLFGDLGTPITISSTGVGIRWQISPAFVFSADYGYVIRGYITPDHSSRLHFVFSATF